MSDNTLRDHILWLCGLKPESTRAAYVQTRDGERRALVVTAADCFSMEGYWSNFMLADHCARAVPGCTRCGFYPQLTEAR